MSFTEIIGQDKVIKILTNAVKSNKIAHAYIFVGQNSSGRKKTAIEFTKLLNCSTGGCDSCKNCKKITNDMHPEIKIYNRENKNILINDVREIQKQLQLKMTESFYRVVIIDNAEKFTQEAANCFLKTLEEPPAYTVIILLTNSISSLLKTIISRCQIIKFKTLSVQDKIKILEHKTSKKAEEIKNSFLLSSGELGQTLSFLEDNEMNKIILKFSELCKVFLSKEINSWAQKELELLAKDKEIFSKFLNFLLNKIDLKNKNNIEIRLLLQAREFLNRNVNPRLIWSWLYSQDIINF